MNNISKIKQFSSEEQEEFWKKYGDAFKGDIIADLIIRLSKRYVGHKIIDIGAGSGTLIKKLKRKYPKKEVCGFDIAPKDPLVRRCNCTKLDINNKSYDTLFSTDVIEHLGDKDLMKCLKECNRILITGGQGIFTTLNEERLEDHEVMCPQCKCKFHRWGHCQRFNEKRIRKLFEDVGFKVIKIKKMNLVFTAKNKWVSMIIYRLNLAFFINWMFKLNFFNADLFIVTEKVKDI